MAREVKTFQRNVESSLLVQHISHCQHLNDVIIVCEGKKIYGHKIILSMFSEYFHKMFIAAPGVNVVGVTSGISYKQIKQLIDIIYVGKIRVNRSELPELIKARNCLKMRGLGLEALDEFAVTFKATDTQVNNNNAQVNHNNSQGKKRKRSVHLTDILLPTAETVTSPRKFGKIVANSTKSEDTKERNILEDKCNQNITQISDTHVEENLKELKTRKRRFFKEAVRRSPRVLERSERNEFKSNKTKISQLANKSMRTLDMDNSSDETSMGSEITNPILLAQDTTSKSDGLKHSPRTPDKKETTTPVSPVVDRKESNKCVDNDNMSISDYFPNSGCSSVDDEKCSSVDDVCKSDEQLQSDNAILPKSVPITSGSFNSGGISGLTEHEQRKYTESSKNNVIKTESTDCCGPLTPIPIACDNNSIRSESDMTEESPGQVVPSTPDLLKVKTPRSHSRKYFSSSQHRLETDNMPVVKAKNTQKNMTEKAVCNFSEAGKSDFNKLNIRPSDHIEESSISKCDKLNSKQINGFQTTYESKQKIRSDETSFRKSVFTSDIDIFALSIKTEKVEELNPVCIKSFTTSKPSNSKQLVEHAKDCNQQETQILKPVTFSKPNEFASFTVQNNLRPCKPDAGESSKEYFPPRAFSQAKDRLKKAFLMTPEIKVIKESKLLELNPDAVQNLMSFDFSNQDLTYNKKVESKTEIISTQEAKRVTNDKNPQERISRQNQTKPNSRKTEKLTGVVKPKMSKETSFKASQTSLNQRPIPTATPFKASEVKLMEKTLHQPKETVAHPPKFAALSPISPSMPIFPASQKSIFPQHFPRPPSPGDMFKRQSHADTLKVNQSSCDSDNVNKSDITQQKPVQKNSVAILSERVKSPLPADNGLPKTPRTPSTLGTNDQCDEDTYQSPGKNHHNGLWLSPTTASSKNFTCPICYKHLGHVVAYTNHINRHKETALR